MSILDRYDYQFPASLIATSPTSPRDAARLLVCRRDDGLTTEAAFRDLPKFLPPRAVIVFNETRVIPARLTLQKTATGGKVVVLIVTQQGDAVRVMADRRLEIGARLMLRRGYEFTVVGHEEKYWVLRPEFPMRQLDELVEKYGQTPLPPYIKNSPLDEKAAREKYQAVFARERGSVAAPTASLHFTRRLLQELQRHGHDVEFITLHVGLGTFAPVTEENLKKGRLHRETFNLTAATAKRLNAAKAAGRPIVAVGTTVMRTLESAVDKRGRLTRLAGETDLFIRPGYQFNFVDGLITNFHVPKSSLLMLVSAFASDDLVRDWYAAAIRRKFKLFSFGDGMLIL